LIPKYAVLEAVDEDSLCPIMIAEGPFESYVIQIDTVSINAVSYTHLTLPTIYSV